VVAQAYLHTTRPNPGDPREHMHQAALQGLKMVGNKLSAKEEEAYRKKEHINQGHHAVMIRLKRIYNFLCSMLVFTPFA
jgi:hypothetical protein